MLHKTSTSAVSQWLIIQLLPICVLTVVLTTQSLSLLATPSAVLFIEPNTQKSFFCADTLPATQVDSAVIYDGDLVYTVVDKFPSFPGGNRALGRYFSKAINYPTEAIQQGVEGSVYVNFFIAKDGSIQRVSVIKGLGAGCDEEALRVVQQMPRWKPGRHDGQPVNVVYNMPVPFWLGNRTIPK